MHRSDRSVARVVHRQARISPQITQIKCSHNSRNSTVWETTISYSKRSNSTASSDLGEFARRICNRHYGAGGDGIAIIGKLKGDEADFSCRIFNPDGSEAGLSGNGTRCAVAYLYYKGLWTRDELRLSTRTGLKRYFLRGQPAPGKFVFESELGQPKFDTQSIPMSITPPLRESDWLSVAGEWRAFHDHGDADGKSQLLHLR